MKWEPEAIQMGHLMKFAWWQTVFAETMLIYSEFIGQNIQNKYPAKRTRTTKGGRSCIKVVLTGCWTATTQRCLACLVQTTGVAWWFGFLSEVADGAQINRWRPLCIKQFVTTTRYVQLLCLQFFLNFVPFYCTSGYIDPSI